MKKYLLSLFLGYSGIVSALGNCEENFLFDVVIINKTSQDCSLLNYSVDNGQIQSKQLTTTIQSGMQGQRYNFCDPSNYYKQTLVTMNVQCGTDKFVTLQTQRKLDTTFFRMQNTLKATQLVYQI